MDTDVLGDTAYCFRTSTKCTHAVNGSPRIMSFAEMSLYANSLAEHNIAYIK